MLIFVCSRKHVGPGDRANILCQLRQMVYRGGVPASLRWLLPLPVLAGGGCVLRRDRWMTRIGTEEGSVDEARTSEANIRSQY